jgi:transcription initiation factor TFIID subunit 7
LDASTPAVSDTGDIQTPGDLGEADEDEEDENGDEVEGDIDEELAAELDLALENDEEDGDDEDDDDDSDESESEDDDDDDSQAVKLLNEEVRDLEAAVAKKRNEVAASSNPLIRVIHLTHNENLFHLLIPVFQKRFEDALKKLDADLEMKLAQRDGLKEKNRLRKEGISVDDAANGNDDGEIASDDDLFGDGGELEDM